MKKEWKKPVMTVVAKSKIEENVLWACKHASGPEPDTGPSSGFCGYDWPTGEFCNAAFPS